MVVHIYRAAAVYGLLPFHLNPFWAVGFFGVPALIHFHWR